jgi:hypothetical protein
VLSAGNCGFCASIRALGGSRNVSVLQLGLKLGFELVEMLLEALRIRDDPVDRIRHEARHVDESGQLFGGFAVGLEVTLVHWRNQLARLMY